jgi:hypothetical protein
LLPCIALAHPRATGQWPVGKLIELIELAFFYVGTAALFLLSGVIALYMVQVLLGHIK